jgi:hypothetical protein
MQQPAYGAPPGAPYGAPYGAPPGAPYGAPPGAPYGAPPQGKHELLHSCVACVTLTFGCSFLASAQAPHTVPHHQERTHSKAHRMELPQVSPSAPLYPWLVLCPVDTVDSHVNPHSDSGGWWWWMQVQRTVHLLGRHREATHPKATHPKAIHHKATRHKATHHKATPRSSRPLRCRVLGVLVASADVPVIPPTSCSLYATHPLWGVAV